MADFCTQKDKNSNNIFLSIFFDVQKKTLAKEKHTSRSRPTPDRYAATLKKCFSQGSSARTRTRRRLTSACGLQSNPFPHRSHFTNCVAA